jgi:hypothetical protein
VFAQNNNSQFLFVPTGYGVQGLIREVIVSSLLIAEQKMAVGRHVLVMCLAVLSKSHFATNCKVSDLVEPLIR